MDGFLFQITSAIALILIIEGLLYLVFPDFIRKMMATALSMPVEKLRTFGFCMIVSGALVLWIYKQFYGG